MKCLITGASGFVGPYLADELERHGHQVFLSGIDSAEVRFGDKTWPLLNMNLLSLGDLERVLHEVQPEAVFHLAGISHQVQAMEHRSLVAEVNGVGTHMLCRVLSAMDYKKSLLVVSSAQVYGTPKDSVAVNENMLPNPEGAYAHSKLAAEHLAMLYDAPHLAVYVARPFNHIGPGQSKDFVAPGFARRVAECPEGGTIRVGNLNVERDFSDVRDIVRAYRLILEKQPEERVFVLGRGQSILIRDLLETFISLSGKNIYAEVDASLVRDGEAPKLHVDPSLALRVLGWEASIPLEQTLQEIYREVARDP